MKDNIHPEYRHVVFKDMASDFAFLTRSAAPAKDKITWEDGNEYPMIKIDISSASHPFFTGKMKFLDTEGRVDRFMKKYRGGKKAERK